jgi:hypothetical protein
MKQNRVIQFSPLAPALIGCLAWGWASVLAGGARAETISFPTLGFEDDVDVVVSPGRAFLIVPEENEDGTEAKVTIVALNPGDGAPIAVALTGPVPGFENGVDPVILPEWEDGHSVVIPVESEDGSESGVLLLRLNPAGGLIEFRAIDLGDLGFREDVDLVWDKYMEAGIALLPLESEDRSVRGVLAIDIDPVDAGGDGLNAWGTCTLLSTDGRSVCGTADLQVDWLPGLAEGVDPVVYETGFSARLALPVADAGGCDLLLLDFDTTFEPPVFGGHSSVKEINAEGDLPLAFPGWENNVHLHLIRSLECGVPAPMERILIPVEEAGADGDLYCIDGETAVSEWVLSEEAGALGLTVLGYEKGVDVIPVCGLAAAPFHRVAVPLENAAGTDADLWIVNAETGELIARAEDPALNPGLVIPGYEIGVDPVRWDDTILLVPAEGGGSASLLALNVDAALLDELSGDPVIGFERSVDAVVAPLGDPDRKLYVPVESADGSDPDILIFATAGDLAVWNSLVDLNPGLELSGFEWDVDLGLVDHWLPGQAWIYLPEEDETGVPARLRCEHITAAARLLVVATPEVGVLPATLYTVHGGTGDVLFQLDDVYGLETGLDMTNGTGHVTTGNPPLAGIAPGSDPDTDPTLIGLVASSAVPEAERPGETLGLRLRNPVFPPQTLHFTMPEAGNVRVDVVDVAGRIVRTVQTGHTPAGEQAVVLDGRDDRGKRLPAGAYFLRIVTGRGQTTAKLVILER